jgi:PKD repeat protein
MKFKLTYLLILVSWLINWQPITGQTLDCGSATNAVVNCTADGNPVEVCDETTNNLSNVSDYCSFTGNTGQEEIIFLNLLSTTPGTVQQVEIEVTLENETTGTDLDLFILGSCDPQNCLASGWTVGDEFVSFTLDVFGSRDIILVVDGYSNGNPTDGEYKLTIEAHPVNQPNVNLVNSISQELEDQGAFTYCASDFPDNNALLSSPVGGTGIESYWFGGVELFYGLTAKSRVYKIEHDGGDITVDILQSDFPLHTFLYREDFNITGGCTGTFPACHLCYAHGTENVPLSLSNADAGTYFVIVDGDLTGTGFNDNHFTIDINFNDAGCADCECTSFIYGAATIVCDGLEGYASNATTSNMGPPWSTFPSPNQLPANIGQQVVYEGTQSLFFTNSSDAVLDLGNQSVGRYRLEWQLNTTNFAQPRFGVLYDYDNNNASNNIWAFNCHFEGNGNGNVYAGTSSSNSLASFSYSENQWIPIVHIIDLDVNTYEIWIDNQIIHQGAFTGNIDVLNIFNAGPGGTVFYTDSYCLRQPGCDGLPCTLNIDPVCVNGQQFDNSCYAQCAGYTENEWEDGDCASPPTSCNECTNCFDYHHVNGSSTTLQFYSNHCLPPTTAASFAATTIGWDVTDQSGFAVQPQYLNGTTQNSYDPIMELPPGQYTVCFSEYTTGYECCLIVFVEPNPCYDPPVCYVDGFETGDGFNLDASGSIGGDAYHWDLPPGVDLIFNSSTNDESINFVTGSGCYNICVSVTNECGVGSYCVEVCSDCTPSTPTPPGGPITPTISNGELTFSGVPSSGYTYEWEVDGGDFTNGTNSSSANPVINYNDFGEYLVCLKLTSTNNCANSICICWTVYYQPVPVCERDLCNSGIIDDCLNMTYDYTGNYTNGSLDYSFYNSGVIPPSQFCQWEVHAGTTIGNNPIYTESNSDLGFDYSFSEPGFYIICYKYWNGFADCVEYCCRTIFVENPLSCGNEKVTYQYLTNQNGFQFTLNGNYTQISWTDDFTGNSLGTGSVSNILEIVGGCQTRLVSVRYYDPSTECWYICCIQFELCPPQDCELAIEYEWDFVQQNFVFSLNPNGGQVDVNDIVWQNDDTGNTFGFGEISAAYEFPLPNPCVAQTISVRYRDPVTNCWYICCRTIWLCNPAECADLYYFYNGSTIEVGIDGIGVQSGSVSWYNDTDNVAIPINNDPLTVTPFPTLPTTNCAPKWISIRYYDNIFNTWRICCRLIYFCDPDICGSDEIAIENTVNDEYSLEINPNFSSIIWYVDEASVGSNNQVTTTLLPNITYRICVHYFDPFSGCWYVCCRDYTPEVDNDCEKALYGNPIICDKFEDYNSNQTTDNMGAPWSTYPNGDPAFISDAIVYQGNQSLRFLSDPNENSDVLLDLGNQSIGVYRLEWEMYIGTEGRMDIEMLYENDDLQSTAYWLSFQESGELNVLIGNTSISLTTFNHNEWMSVVQVIDLNADVVELWVGDVFITSWQYSLGNPNNGNTIGQLYLSSYLFGEDAYLDDFCFQEAGCMLLDIDCSQEGGPVCVNGTTFPNPCEARCQGYTAEEWEEGECYGCDDCLDCFYYLPADNNASQISFYNNYCPEFDPAFPVDVSDLSYQWMVFDETQNNITGTIDFVNGTNNLSENPTCGFPTPGNYRVCLMVFGAGELIYECCLWLPIAPEPCYNYPTAQIDVSEFAGTFNLSGSGSIGVENYAWDYPFGVSPTTADNGAFFSCEITQPGCYTICLTVTNECGFGSYCVDICNDLGCNDPVPPSTPAFSAVVDDLSVTFPDAPTSGWSEVSWSALGASFGNGSSASSFQPTFEFSTYGTYIICASYTGPSCEKICICWTVPLPPPDPCQQNPCEENLNCDDLQFDFIGNFSTGTVAYSFFNNGFTGGDEFCRWELYLGNNDLGTLVESSTNDNFDVNFTTAELPDGFYTVCYYWWDVSESCLKACCRTIYVDSPLNCQTTVGYEWNDNQNTFQFSLNGVNSVDNSSIVWQNEDDDTVGEFGFGETNPTYTGPINCTPQTISVRYFDTATNCWYICCRTIYLCAPNVCGLLQITINETSNDNYSLSIPGNFTNVEWFVDENFTGTTNTVNTSLFEGNTYYICVYYFDFSSGCWYICCRTFTPENCDLPVANYTYSVNDMLVSFGNNSVSTEGNPTYFWAFGDGSTSTLANPTHTYSNPGTYTCCLTVTDDCGENSYCSEISVEGSTSNNPPWGNPTPTTASGVLHGQAQIDGFPASGMDWISAFDEDGNLAGSSQLLINNGIAFINLTIYGDDPSTSNIDEGISGNESFELRLYDANENYVLIYPTISAPILFSGWQNSNGAPMPNFDDVNQVYNFLNTTEVTDIINLNAGWNLISTDVIPADSSITSIFSSLISGNLQFVTGFDNGASFFDPNGLPFLNTLHSFERGFGYWVKVGQDDVLEITGEPISETYKKSLDENWNLVAYPPQYNTNPAIYFSELINTSNLEYVTGFNGSSQFFDPNGLPFLNTLTVLQNGFGYWVRVMNAVSGQSFSGGTLDRNKGVISNQYNFIAGTTNLPEGKKISIIDDSGNKLGVLETLANGVIRTAPVYLDENRINQTTKIYFQHDSVKLNSNISLSGNYEIFKMTLNFPPSRFESSSIDNCFPNPFSQTLNIDYSAYNTSFVKIEIYDITGKKVWKKNKKNLLSGRYTETINTTMFGNGIYLVKLTADNRLIDTKTIICQ